MAFSKALEEVIDAALADGVLTDKERAVLHKKALQEGVDPDELDVVIEGRLAKMKREEDWLRPTPPATEKLGNIVKCPNCGASVAGGSAVCPDCGYEFRNVGVASSYSAFIEGLNQIARKNAETNPIKAFGKIYTKGFSDIAGQRSEEYTYISTYPVPNTSEDLLQFLSAIQPKAKKTGEYDEADAYYILLSNCINKAQFSFSKDPRFAPYFEFYNKNKNKMSSNTKAGLVSLLLIVIIFGIGGYFLSQIERNKDEGTYTEQQTQQITTEPQVVQNVEITEEVINEEPSSTVLPITEQNVTFDGKIGEYPVVMTLHIAANGEVTGAYYYKKKGPGNYLYLKGEKSGDNISLKEFTKSGEQTGTYEGTFGNGGFEGHFSTTSGNYDFVLEPSDIGDIDFSNIDFETF